MQTTYAGDGRQTGALPGVLAGMAGGLLGSWLMVRFNHLVGGWDENRRPEPRHRMDASPNAHDGTISDEPGSRQAASAIATAAVGRPLTERGKDYGGPLFHYGFGAAAGALYGAAARWRPELTAAAGLPFGAAVWLLAAEMGMPAAGLARDPRDYPLARHASSLASHLVFGLTVEAVRRGMAGAPRHQADAT